MYGEPEGPKVTAVAPPLHCKPLSEEQNESSPHMKMPLSSLLLQSSSPVKKLLTFR